MLDESKGFLALKNGDYQEAVNLFKRLLELKISASAYSGLGIAYYRLGDRFSAKWAFHKALEIDPKDKDAMDHLIEIENFKANSFPAENYHTSLFRTAKDYFEVYLDGTWKRIFLKGINIGLGLPGYFPGEFSIKKETYFKWFELIHRISINVVRIYTIHPPEFYEVLYEFNRTDKRIYFFQGIWTELPEKNNFKDKKFLDLVRREIENAVDVVMGNIVLPQKLGHASGDYRFDTSPFLAGFIFGREWESCAIKEFNKFQQNKNMKYESDFLKIDNASPFELWITEMCDYIQVYENEKYGVTHPVSVINWPTLDPIVHPSESNYEDELKMQGFAVNKNICKGNEDEVSLDVSKIKLKKGKGFFATYHVYPQHPDFMSNDYPESEEAYLSYLLEIKRHHRNQPVLIAEFGVPSSRDSAHWQINGFHHGGHSEKRQGEINGKLIAAIHKAGMAGGLIFSLFDEWCKTNWLFSDYEIPVNRLPSWFNFQNPEQNYGLIGTYPGYPGKTVTLSGNKNEWEEATKIYEKEKPLLRHIFDDGSDLSRAIKRFAVNHDEGFLYLLIETFESVDLLKTVFLVGIDTCAPETGEFRLPYNLGIISPVGLKFLIEISGKESSRILVSRYYDKRLNENQKIIKPTTSYQGEWIIIQNLTNRRRISKDGKKVFPSRTFTVSKFRFGSLSKGSPDYDSLSDFFYSENMIEVRIPWGLINFVDPSSRLVLWKDENNNFRKSEGIRFIVISYKPEKGSLKAMNTGREENIANILPDPLSLENVRAYTWQEWNTPIFHFYLKESYYIYGNYLSFLPEIL